MSHKTDAATAARRMPEGEINVKVAIRLPASQSASLENLSPIARGHIWLMAIAILEQLQQESQENQ